MSQELPENPNSNDAGLPDLRYLGGWFELLKRKTHFGLRSFDIAFSLFVFGIAIYVRLMGATASVLLGPDEITYVEAGRMYISSLAGGKLFSPWGFNFEHPALAKYLIGLSILLLPLPTHVAARMPSVVLGSLTCVLTYFLGREFFGERTGLIGSILLAFNVPSIVGSTEAMLETPLAFFSVLSLLLLCCSQETGTTKVWLLSGVSFGLAMACKFSAVFLMMICVPYIFLGKKKREAVLLCLTWLVVGGLAFYAIQPRYWLDPAGALWESVGLFWRRTQKGRWYDTYFMGETYDVAPPHYLVVVMFARANLCETVGLLSGVFLLLTRIRRGGWNRKILFLGLTVLSPFLYLSLVPLKLSHYLVMCMPGVMLLAGYGVGNAFKPTVTLKKFSTIFLFSILLLYSIGSVIESYPSFFYYNPIIGRENYIYLIGHPGGGVPEAVRWIEYNVPEDTRIGLIGFEQEFQQLDSRRKYVRFNYWCSLHHVRDVNKVRYLIVQMNMAERVQNPLWKAVSQMEPVFVATLRGVPTIQIYDFGPR